MFTRENQEARTGYKEIDGGAMFNLYEGFPDLNIQLSGKSAFRYTPYWYNGITYSDEFRRGFDCREDLFVPGEFVVELKPGDSVVLSASVNEENSLTFTARQSRLPTATTFLCTMQTF